MCQIIVWSKYGSTDIKEYPDSKLYEDNELVIMKYYGQNCGRRDYLITAGVFMIKNKENKWVNIGQIINVINIGCETIVRSIKKYDVKLYKLVISKTKQKITQTKNDMCKLFKLSTMNSFERMHGITSHTIILEP